MFIGEYNHTLDDKGRVIMPVIFRQELGQTFYITKGFDNCLFVFDEAEWEKFGRKLEKSSMQKKNYRRLQRTFIASANKCSFDKQGRFLISNPLREYAFLKKELVIIGVSNRIEIWSKEKWIAYNEDEDFDLTELAEELDEIEL